MKDLNFVIQASLRVVDDTKKEIIIHRASNTSRNICCIKAVLYENNEN